jgi:E3 ubiquitin-protein ligase FANCL
LGHLSSLVGADASKPNASQKDEVVQECGICYVFRLVAPETKTAELPDELCANCARPFHRSCIIGWLRALPSTKRSFKLMVGECPYCGENITVRDD